MVQHETVNEAAEEHKNCVRCRGARPSGKIYRCCNPKCANICHLACRGTTDRDLSKTPKWICCNECAIAVGEVTGTPTLEKSMSALKLQTTQLEYEKELASCHQQIAKLQEALNKSLDHNKEKIGELLKEKDELTQELDDLEHENLNLKKENAELKQENADMKQQLSEANTFNPESHQSTSHQAFSQQIKENEQRQQETDRLIERLNKSMIDGKTEGGTPSSNASNQHNINAPRQEITAFAPFDTKYLASSDGSSNATNLARERVRSRRERDAQLNSVDPHAHRTQQDLSRLKLARQNLDDIRTFKGDRFEWIAFEEEVYTYWDTGEYSDFEMIKKLRKALDGDAKNYVKLALNTPEAKPEHVMETLRRKYYHPNEAVSAALKEITSMEAVRRKYRKPLENLLTAVESYIHVCNLVQIREHLHGRVNGEVECKLPQELRADWNKLIRTGTHDDGSKYSGTWMEFWQFLRDSVEDLPLYEPSNTSSGPKRTDKRFTNHTQSKIGKTGGRADNKWKCRFDSCDQKLYKCTAFKGLQFDDKLKFIRDNKMCHKCLNSSQHVAKDCPLQQLLCRAENCSDPKNHSTVIHPPKGRVLVVRGPSRFTSFQIVPIYVYNAFNQPIKILAFLDSGSDTTIMNHALYSKLKLPGKTHQLDVSWCAAGVSSVDKASRIFNCTIENVEDSTKKFQLVDVVTMKNFSLPAQGQDPEELKSLFPHLKNVPLQHFDSSQPQILIGLEHRHLMVPEKVVKKQNCPIVAELTALGWVVSGSIKQNDEKNFVFQSSGTSKNPHDDLKLDELNAIIKKFINEDISISKTLNSGLFLTPDEKRAAEIQERFMERINNRYHVGMYWTSDDVQLPDNYTLAESRLISQEFRLKKLDMVDWANKHIQLLLDSNFARRATAEDLSPTTPHKRINYVPGFVTFNHNKTPPKPRWVVDTACKFQGVSLNSVLLKGADNLVPLTKALFHFRERKYATVADVEKMYHQVMIIPQDQNCQRFLWRWCDATKKPEIFIHQAMMFGPTDSPSKANAVKLDHANKSREKYPNAARIAENSTYVDDVFNSEDKIEVAVAAAEESISMFDEISWKLVDFRSNSSEILQRLPESRRNQQFMLDLAKDETIEKYKVLGLFWDPIRDAFIFQQTAEFNLKMKTQREGYIPTKREILSFITRIFDPLGLICHLIVRGRMIMQKTWMENIGWDSKLPAEVFKMWQQWIDEVDQISKLVIPRHYKFNSDEVEDTSLHMFSDAGADGFASVAFFRFVFANKDVHVQQIASKAKVSPIKYLSIAKKELSAAVASVNLAKMIKTQHPRMNISSTTYYVDSEITLKWIRNPALKLQQYVAPRVTQIWDDTEIKEWRYVPSNQNPADFATKWAFKEPVDYANHNHPWFQGPKFLWDREIKFPSDEAHQNSKNINHTVVVVKQTEREAYYAGTLEFVKPSIRADWKRFISTVAGMMRFIANLKLTIDGRQREKVIDTIITPAESYEAMKLIVKAVQKATWPEAFKSLIGGHFIRSKKSVDLNTLNPVIGEDGLLRSMTRMSHETSIPYDTRFPIILPSKHEITDAIIISHHNKNHHIAYESAIAKIRETFWIIHIRQAVRRVIANCTTCIKIRARPYNTPRAPLPSVRVTATTKAFENVGADVFGPFIVYTRRSNSKRQVWCVIFTCLVSRAVYLKMIDSLTADEMMLAIQELWTRRGPVKSIYSDNGKNFVKCSEIIKDIQRSKLAKEKGISWHFNPPYTPQWGGAWERLIRDIKRAFKATIGKNVVSEKVFQSILFQTEDIMNSRPLTHIPVSPDDDQPLTPNLLIKLHPGNPIVVEDDGNINSALTIKQSYDWAKQIIKRWTKEYLPIIAKHPVSTKQQETLKKGDYVMYIDPTALPEDWPKGVICEIYPGRDGIARTADVKLPGGTVLTRRSAFRLAKLEPDGSKLFQQPTSKIVNNLFQTTIFKRIGVVTAKRRREDNQSDASSSSSAMANQARRDGPENLIETPVPKQQHQPKSIKLRRMPRPMKSIIVKVEPK